MKLSVVILNWNAAADTDRAVRSVKAWDAETLGGSPTLWVVDNGSQEPGVEELEREHPEARFLRAGDNLGFAGGNNLGISAALDLGSEAVLLLNNDASVDEQSVAAMLATLESEACIGVVGPTLWDGETLLSVGGKDIALHGATHLKPRCLPQSVLDVDYVSGTVALVARQVFETVGLLDEDFFFAGEMADLCLRARQQGFRCVTEPRATATHDLQRSSELRERLHAYYVLRNRFLFIQKHYASQRMRLRLAWTARGAWGFVSALVRGNLPRARSLGLGLVDGWRGRFGRPIHRALS